MSSSKKWPRLQAEILACMPTVPKEPMASGQIIAAVCARFASEPPSRHTIQRALEDMEIDGLVGKAGTSRDRVWWRTEKHAPSELARRPPLELAIALITLKRHARHHLPSHVVGELEAFFAGAERVLGESPTDMSLSHARAWANKTVRVDAGYPLISPPVGDDILNAIRKALYLSRVLEVTYQNSQLDNNAPETYKVVPLGLVERGPVLYLVASRQRRGGDFKLYQLRLDRFVSAVCSETPAVIDPDFDLNGYVRDHQAFSFLPERQIRLELRVREEDAYRHLFREQWLAADQEIIDEPGGFRLHATVMLSVALRNLLMERSARVEVLAPADLRQEIAENLRAASRRYE
ncbi:WYL domain-containing protein [Cupriavidus sp. DF5525]|uniref:helix-turn-helix transcriptional regulator n=1 Tax=Cupriavidus sp. DF5525 TaxID=3160989 RepID=UPI0032DED5A8